MEVYECEKYYYNIDVTYGFIIGFILDNIIPATFGMFTKVLKRFGRVLFSKEIRYNNMIVRFICE